jgi:ferric enterobactin receptor
MKRFLLFAILLMAAGQARSQTAGTVSGVIIDSVSNSPVDYATIALFPEGKTTSVNGAMADDKGMFSVQNVPAGNYRVVVNFLGYTEKTIPSVAVKAGTLNLGKILLSPSATQLAAVDIQGERPLIENKIDRLVYNAEKDVTSSGGNATDVLRKVPLLSVDMDGNVSLRGDQNVKILINGKPSGAMSNSVGDALKMIPADQIANVEVITSPSAKYDAEGTSGIINIVTKKKDITGINGSVNAGVGTRQNNTSANLNVRRGKIGVVANGGANWSWPATTLTSFNQINNAGDIILSQRGESEAQRGGGRGSIGLDYDLNDRNLFNTTFSLTSFGMDLDGNSLTNFGNYNGFSSKTVQERGFSGFDWSAGYTHKFAREKQELAFVGQFSRNENNTDYNTFYTDSDRLDELGVNDGTNDELTLQIDYTHPIRERATLELGVKTILRDISSLSTLQEMVGSAYVLNEDRSYDYNYDQNVGAAYASLNYSINDRYQIMAGVRGEYTELNGESVASFDAFKNDYVNILPSAVVSRKLGQMSSLKLSYNQRIQRPSLFYLNPFRNTADPVNQSEGNPELKPELSHNFELGYSTFIKGTVINASVYYRLTDDVIESLITNIENPDQSGQPIVLQTFDNIGQNKSVGANLFLSVTPVRNLTLRTNLSVNTYNTRADLVNGNLSTEADKTYLLYRAFVNASYNIANGFIAETFLMSNSPRRTFQGTNASFSMWSLGVKKELFDKKASVGINILDPFNETKHFDSKIHTPNYTQKTNVAVPFRSFGITLSWNFGKMDFKNAPRQRRGINNDDQKQEDGQQGPGMTP